MEQGQVLLAVYAVVKEAASVRDAHVTLRLLSCQALTTSKLSQQLLKELVMHHM